jgi:hypothetical protein
MWLADVGEQEQERLRTVINRLLAANFLVKEKEREAYYLIRRHRERLEQFFHALGWNMVVDDRHECVFVHAPDSRLRRSLNREQTIWFLVLRLIYEEKRQGLSLSDSPLTSVYEVRNKYETFRLPWINRTQLEKLVRLCVRYQLLEPLDDDIRSDECRLRLFHTWMYVVDTEELAVIQEKLERFAEEPEGGLLDEMDEKAAVD